MEVEALMKGKDKNKGKGKGKEKGKEKGKDKPKEGTSDTSSMKCFFCKEKGHGRKDCPKGGSLRRRQSVTSTVQTPLRKTDGSLPWITSMRICVS